MEEAHVTGCVPVRSRRSLGTL